MTIHTFPTAVDGKVLLPETTVINKTQQIYKNSCKYLSFKIIKYMFTFYF